MAIEAANRLGAVNQVSTQVWILVCGSLQLPASRAGSAPREAPRMRVTDADSAVITQARPTVHDQPGCSQSGPRRRVTSKIYPDRVLAGAPPRVDRPPLITYRG